MDCFTLEELMSIIWLRRLLMYHNFGPRGLYYSAVFGRLRPCLIFALDLSGYKSYTFAELLKRFFYFQVSGCAFAVPGFKSAHVRPLGHYDMIWRVGWLCVLCFALDESFVFAEFLQDLSRTFAGYK